MTPIQSPVGNGDVHSPTPGETKYSPKIQRPPFLPPKGRPRAEAPAKKAGGLTKRAKLLILAGLTLCLCAYNGWLLLHCFTTPAKPQLNIGQIHPPVMAAPLDSRMDLSDGRINARNYKSLMGFKAHLDSLAASAGGQMQYKAFMQSHPGFLDSLELLNQLFQQQLRSPQHR
ncbi:hypothetical protein [Chitinophaga sp. Ak27]|uniref:hypothetical protein n=1 Tax=Chitinophaga sp. Ak27 TaxID=2726116 RepID=UPI00145FA9CB|nr:hypothetical protein [Chitinophaga sp. Ak27]NLU94843.1 hypothetical protein [Chitinophaga sp. Ak27]